MNIVLADDERLPRLGLKSMIEELYPEQHSFIELTNGEELLLYVEDHTPDVIFLDIHMPKLSGLDAFAQFHTKDIPVVMLTGYAEFAYAQKALTYGAIDYILKPAALEDIQKVMEKIMQLKQKELSAYQKDYELECKKILDLYFSIQFIQQPKYVQPPYTVMIFYFDHDPKSSKKNNFDLLSTSLTALSEKYSFPCGCGFLPSGELIYITTGQLPRTLINHIPEDFQKLSSCLATGFVYYADSIEDLLRRISYVQKLESIHLCTSLGKCIFLDELTAKEAFLPLSTLLDKAILALQLQDSVNLHKALADLRNLKHGDALLSQCDISLARVFELTFHHPVETSSIAQLADSIQQMFLDIAVFSDSGRCYLTEAVYLHEVVARHHFLHMLHLSRAGRRSRQHGAADRRYFFRFEVTAFQQHQHHGRHRMVDGASVFLDGSDKIVTVDGFRQIDLCISQQEREQSEHKPEYMEKRRCLAQAVVFGELLSFTADVGGTQQIV